MSATSSTGPSPVYLFGPDGADGDGSMKPLLGGKGAGLAEMCRLGLPVPAGFTIPTDVSLTAGADGAFPPALTDELRRGVAHIERAMGARFGDPSRPLLLSVRSGARQSMPGMMDTILNVGLNHETVEGLARATDNARFAWDSFRRLIQMFGDVVLGVHAFYFEEELHAARVKAGVEEDHELQEEDLRGLVDRYLALVETRTGAPFPMDPWLQIEASVRAVFASWHNDRARAYRELNDIPHHWGTACNLQAMVFGNRGPTSGTGVAFTRDPSTGENAFYGEYLPNAQGEDVVAGIRTPLPLAGEHPDALVTRFPSAYQELDDIRRVLEKHYGDMQDLEFTIEEGKVWILQTRSGKRTAQAALRIAVELASEGSISEEDAVLLVAPERLDALLHPQIDPDAPRDVLATGLPASPGAACGALAFTAEEAVERAEAGEAVILVRPETTPEDIRGMSVAAAILTARGGMTSHAAVVARQMGRTCVVGCHALHIDPEARTLRIGDRVLGPQDILTLDGTRGEVLDGRVSTKMPELTETYATLMGWADRFRTIGVRANADTGPDAALARTFGAEGIGLARTEHMFFDESRINTMREMILAPDASARRAALARLKPEQQLDFEALLEAMAGLPVTIRLLDPPLHEFLPTRDEDIEEVAHQLGVSADEVRRWIEKLEEANPMLGHRGCRLGLTAPEIYAMQVEAIADAIRAVRARGVETHPEIMIPLIATEAELARLRSQMASILEDKLEGAGPLPLLGTMIELPRACIAADKIARHADFFSFGTNDLTQTTFGLSRDDASHFLPAYVADEVLPYDPFVVLDTEGVGVLIDMAIARGRATRPDLKIGICGEHGGEPKSVAWLQREGRVHYVSCSPWRVPVARLSAAQAAIRDRRAAEAVEAPCA